MLVAKIVFDNAVKNVDVKNGSAEGVLFIMFIDKYGYNS